MDAVVPIPPEAPLPAWARTRKWPRVGLAILSALLLALSFPLARQWWAAWIALTPLYLVLATAPQTRSLPGGASARSGGWAGFWFGFVLHLSGAYWMLVFDAVPWVVLAAIQGVPFAAFGVIMAWLLPRLGGRLRPVAFALGWVVLEWARYQGKYAFPWFPLAASQAPVPLLLQILSVTGQWGITFAIAFSCAWFGEAWLKPRRTGKRKIVLRWFAPLKVVAFIALLGLAVMGLEGERLDRRVESSDPNARRIGIAQGSDFRPGEDPLGVYSDLTRGLGDTAMARTGKPLDLIVWPETPLPNDVLHDPLTRPRLSALADGLHTPLLIGSEIVNGRDRFNSALLFAYDGGLGGRYDKQQLVPMGEFFLFRSLLGPIYENYSVPATDMMPGTKVGVYPTGRPDAPMRVGVLICYESAFPMRARDCARAGAEVICLLTSDSTFGKTAGPRQHADMAVLRAIETRRWVVRAALTGTSQFVEPSGAVVQSLGLMERGGLTHNAALRNHQTLYVRLGDWFVWAAIGVLTWVAGRTVLANREHRAIKAASGTTAVPLQGELP